MTPARKRVTAAPSKVQAAQQVPPRPAYVRFGNTVGSVTLGSYTPGGRFLSPGPSRTWCRSRA